MTTTTLGARIKHARTTDLHTLESLSEATGIHASRLEAFEADLATPNVPELFRIADATSTSALEIAQVPPVFQTAGGIGGGELEAQLRRFHALSRELDDQAIPARPSAGDAFLDRIAADLGIDQASAEQRRADALVANDVEFLRALVGLRRSKGLSLPEVAARMGVAESAVADFEADGADPDLSTIRRYAHAIGARLSCTVVDDTAEVDAQLHDQAIPDHNDWLRSRVNMSLAVGDLADSPLPVHDADGRTPIVIASSAEPIGALLTRIRQVGGAANTIVDECGVLRLFSVTDLSEEQSS